MKKINKFVVGITLFLFLGQTFAALKMSCEVPNTLSHDAGTAVAAHTVHVSQMKAHAGAHHQNASVPANSTSALKNVLPGSACDADHQSCYCSTGTCSTFFLPATSHVSVNNSVAVSGCASCSYHNHQPSTLFRPPISI